MPAPDDVTGHSFMAFNGNVMLPGIVVHSAVFWPLHPPVGPSLNLFIRAIDAGLDQVRALSPAAITAIFKNPSPGWRAIGDPGGGRLRIRDGRGRFDVSELAIADPPAGWWDTADIAERLLLFVIDQPLGSVAGREFGRDLDQIARDGRLCGAAVEFGATDVPVPPLPDDDTVRITVDLTGAVITLADNVAAHIITMSEARSRLRSLSDFLAHELVTAGLPEEELIRRLIGRRTGPTEHVGLDHAVARLVTEFAEIRDPSRTSRLWRESADRAVATGVRALAGGHDPTIFADVAELAGLRLAQLRDPPVRGTKRELARALDAAVRLRLAALGPEHADGDDYALTDGLLNCVTGGRIRAMGGGQTGLPPDLGRCLDQAWELMTELLLLDPGDGQIRPLALDCLLRYELRRAAPGRRDAGLLAKVIEELSGLVDAGTDPVLAMFLARLRSQSDPVRGPAPIARMLAGPAEEFQARHGDLIARRVCSQAILTARETRSRPLLIKALAWSDCLPPPVAGADMRQVFEARGHCLAEDPMPCPDPGADLRGLAEDYRAGHPEWTEGQRAAARLHLAAHARAGTDPALGLALLNDVDVRFKLTEQALLLSADLNMQLALHGGEVAIGRAGGAMMAAGGYAGLGLLELSGAALILLLGHLSEEDESERAMTVSCVVTALPQLRSSRDPVLSRIAHGLAHRAVLAALTDRAPLTVQLALQWAAKGVDFAVARMEDDVFTLPAGIATRRAEWQFLSAVRTAHKLDGTAAEPGDVRLLAYGPYIDYGESAEGSDLVEIEENQRRHLDHLITTALLESRYSFEYPVESLDGIQDRLDDRTVLLSYFLLDGTIDDRDCYVMLAITREDADAVVMISDGTPTAAAAGDQPRRHVMSEEVADVLAAVTRPSPGVMDPEASELLDRAHRVFGNLAALSRWRAEGKDRLCIWPHGPLHFLPFHLYTVDGEPVAAHWTVTMIPGLDAFTGRRPAPRGPVRTRRTVVVGYGDGHDPATAEIAEQVRRHALEVAALTGRDALVGGEATRSRFLAELHQADVIHIAAHGEHDPVAPWFDCFRLHPDGDDDGRVFACDLLATDLRGVRLVTLAACDSALGRFDLNDNLRGIPAGFLLAGAGAVVACLWPVRPEPATMFFGHLHRALAEGSEPLAAFRSAQLAARRRFPRYRDWGAFTYRDSGAAHV